MLFQTQIRSVRTVKQKKNILVGNSFEIKLKGRLTFLSSITYKFTNQEKPPHGIGGLPFLFSYLAVFL